MRIPTSFNMMGAGDTFNPETYFGNIKLVDSNDTPPEGTYTNGAGVFTPVWETGPTGTARVWSFSNTLFYYILEYDSGWKLKRCTNLKTMTYVTSGTMVSSPFGDITTEEGELEWAVGTLHFIPTKETHKMIKMPPTRNFINCLVLPDRIKMVSVLTDSYDKPTEPPASLEGASTWTVDENSAEYFQFSGNVFQTQTIRGREYASYPREGFHIVSNSYFTPASGITTKEYALFSGTPTWNTEYDVPAIKSLANTRGNNLDGCFANISLLEGYCLTPQIPLGWMDKHSAYNPDLNDYAKRTWWYIISVESLERMLLKCAGHSECNGYWKQTDSAQVGEETFKSYTHSVSTTYDEGTEYEYTETTTYVLWQAKFTDGVYWCMGDEMDIPFVEFDYTNRQYDDPISHDQLQGATAQSWVDWGFLTLRTFNGIPIYQSGM